MTTIQGKVNDDEPRLSRPQTLAFKYRMPRVVIWNMMLFCGIGLTVGILLLALFLGGARSNVIRNLEALVYAALILPWCGYILFFYVLPLFRDRGFVQLNRTAAILPQVDRGGQYVRFAYRFIQAIEVERWPEFELVTVRAVGAETKFPSAGFATLGHYERFMRALESRTGLARIQVPYDSESTNRQNSP